MQQLRPEYPRPQFIRDAWVHLNAEREFEFDDKRNGARENWEKGDRAFSRRMGQSSCHL